MGDEVIPGNPVAEIETDKASVAFEAQDEGFIAALLFKEGTEDIAVGTPIAVVVQDADDVAAFSNYTLEDALAATGGSAVTEAPKGAPAPADPPPAAVATATASLPPPPPPPVDAATPAAPAAPAPTAAASISDDLDGQPSWRSTVVSSSPLASLMLAEQLAYEERYGSTGMEPLERLQVEAEAQ